MKKTAFCDFDGTLCKKGTYISMDFMDHLYHANMYSNQSYVDQMKYYSQVKNGELDYEKWCELWGIEWAKGLKGNESRLMDLEARDFFHEFKKHIYPSSYFLTGYLAGKGYENMIVSVGAHEVVKLAAKKLGMSKAYSTKCEIKNGIYTGKLRTNIHLPGGKRKKILRIAREKGIDLKKCIAVGDSFSDIEMLELVGLPVAMNPSNDLLEYAKEHKWNIFQHNTIDGIEKLLG